MYTATVDVAGAISWAADPGEDPLALSDLSDDNFYVLNYGQTDTAAGWMIQPTERGTTITNDRTGHGLSITTDNPDLSTF